MAGTGHFGSIAFSATEALRLLVKSKCSLCSYQSDNWDMAALNICLLVVLQIFQIELLNMIWGALDILAEYSYGVWVGWLCCPMVACFDYFPKRTKNMLLSFGVEWWRKRGRRGKSRASADCSSGCKNSWTCSQAFIATSEKQWLPQVRTVLKPGSKETGSQHIS